jgi:chemotaxis protein methyltransferase CheR
VPEPAFVVAPAPPEPVASAPPVTPITASPGENPLTLARTYANQGRLDEALTSCQDAIAAGRTNPATHFLCAAICLELGRLEEAVASLGTVLYLDQDFILAHLALGDLYKRLGKEKESRRHLAIALELLLARSRDEIVPESDGMTCGRLVESVRAMTGA